MKHTYNITGMTCENCANKIKKVLENINEISKVEVNLEKNIANISMENHVQTPVMQIALNKIGDYHISMDIQTMESGKNTEKNLWNDLKPLFGIIGFLILLTSVVTYFKNGDMLYWMRFFMAYFLICFGILKLIKLRDFATAYSQYDIIAKKSKIYAHAYPFIELGLGILLMVKITPVIVYSLIALVMFIGAIGVFIKLRKKEKIPCACLGTVFKVPMTWVTLAEDLMMVVMAIFMIYSL